MPADLALLVVSAALSPGLGVWRGQTIKVWRDADGTLWRQGSVLTLVLWGVLIAARGLLYGSVSQLAIAMPQTWERCWSRWR